MISGLKANLLIEMNIMRPELTDLLIAKKQASIGSVSTTMPIELNNSNSKDPFLMFTMVAVPIALIDTLIS